MVYQGEEAPLQSTFLPLNLLHWGQQMTIDAEIEGETIHMTVDSALGRVGPSITLCVGEYA